LVKIDLRINYHSVDFGEAEKFDYYRMQQTDYLYSYLAVGIRWNNPSKSGNY